MRQFIVAKLNLNMTSVCNFFRIFQCFQCIRKETFHIIFRFKVILTTVIPHSVLIGNFFLCLDTKQNIVCLGIISHYVMYIVCRNKFNSSLLAHSEQSLIYSCLVRYSVILKFKKKIIFSEYIS